jgi:predicted dehydrogenase
MIGIGVVGYGYWGPNLVRNFMSCAGATVVAVADGRPERRAAVEKLYPAVTTFASDDDLIADPRVDAVVIATPVTTHHPIAMAAIAAGKHVLVEKPMTDRPETSRELVAAAARAGVVLMVDHTFVYTSAVRRIAELVRSGELGKLYYYDSVRVNLGLFQSDVSVIWDLAVHDLSIMDHLLGRAPRTVSATGAAHVPDQPVNIAYLTCLFDDDLIAHFHVNWLAPVKVRQTLIGGSEKMVVFDDVDMSEKVKVYDKGLVYADQSESSLVQKRVGYRTGDMWAPRLDNVEALAVEADHFVECIVNGTTPITDGSSGLRVVEILDAATRSLALGGAPVALDAP